MLWAKYGPYKVYSENLLVLAPGKELEGEVSLLSKKNIHMQTDISLENGLKRYCCIYRL